MAKIDISLEELYEAGAHYGHQTHRWNPKMAPFIYQELSGVHIIDLAQTKAKLLEALEFLSQASQEGKKILLVGSKKQASSLVKSLGEELGLSYVAKRWLGGTLTNFDQIRRTVLQMLDLEKRMLAGEFANRTKVEKLLLQKKLSNMQRFLGGIKNMEAIPDIMIIIDSQYEKVAIKEALKKGVITVSLVDTNADPTIINYPIPINDDANKSLELVLGLIKKALTRKGKK